MQQQQESSSKTHLNRELIKIKARLLCNGIYLDENSLLAYAKQNPYNATKTGNVGLNLILNKRLQCFVSVSHKFNRKSPLHLKWIGDECYLMDNVIGKTLCDIDIVRMPSWYNMKTTNGQAYPTIFLNECSKYMHYAYKGCDYILEGERCLFCSTSSQWVTYDATDVAEVVCAATKIRPDYQVIISGGANHKGDWRDLPYHKYLREIKKLCPNVPVWIEILPSDLEYIKRLMDLGASAFGINLEFWSEDVRRQICPGKSKVSRDKYFQSFELIRSTLGENRVGSVLIVGIEDPSETRKGISELIRMGVRPNLLPFRPWDKSILQEQEKTNHSVLLDLAEYSASLMRKSNINPHENYGCMNCNGCTVEVDFYNYLAQSEDSKE